MEWDQAPQISEARTAPANSWPTQFINPAAATVRLAFNNKLEVAQAGLR